MSNHRTFRTALAIAAVTVLTLVPTVVPAASGTAPAAPTSAAAPAPTPVRIMTFNIQYGKEGLGDILHLIRYYDPQILLLNEVDFTSDGHVDAKDQAWYLADQLSMQFQYFGTEIKDDGKRRGNAILIDSAYRFDRVVRTDVKPESPPYLRGIIRARVDIGDKAIWVGATHLDPGDEAYRQAAFVRDLIGNPGCAMFLGGDMNRTPGTGVHDVLTTHMADVWRRVGTGNNETHGFDTDNPKRIDYIFFDHADPYSADVPSRVYETPGRGVPSDHSPVVATFRISAANSC